MNIINKEIQDFFTQMLNIDSTSGSELKLAEFIINNVKFKRATLDVQEVGDGTVNLFFKWGIPKIVFCSHLDTVPPYIKPQVIEEILPNSDHKKKITIKGRGTCDAKGQLIAQYAAVLELEKQGKDNFGILWVAGEEVGSYGAKKANVLLENCDYVIVGEPTENKMISAGKGTALFNIEIKGKHAHSGYPMHGHNAIERLRVFMNDLSAIEFPVDNILGATTYNIGKLSSQNAHNVISDKVNFRIYFRTTFASYDLIVDVMQKMANENIQIELISRDKPIKFYVVDGFQTGVVAFGSDAPHLTNTKEVILYGPGSILFAHTNEEQITLDEIENAVIDLKNIFNRLYNKSI